MEVPAPFVILTTDEVAQSGTQGRKPPTGGKGPKVPEIIKERKYGKTGGVDRREGQE